MQPLLDHDGALVEPVVVVDLDRDQPDPSAFGSRVVVGLARKPDIDRSLLARLDLALTDANGPPEAVTVSDPATEAARLREAAVNNPHAVYLLANLLRTTESWPVDAAIETESLAYSMLLGGPEFRRWLAEHPARPRPDLAAEPVVLERDAGTLRLTLNRPERRNAYDRSMRDALVEGLRLADLDPSITELRLAGAGPDFCAGGDLDEFGSTPDPVTAHLVRTTAGAGGLLHRLADRTTVCVHGHCVGAGIELPAFAARVIAEPSATFRLPEIGMGLVPGAGGTVSIPRRIGRWRTLYLAMSGRTLSAQTAHEWGLVDEVHPA